MRPLSFFFTLALITLMSCNAMDESTAEDTAVSTDSTSTEMITPDGKFVQIVKIRSSLKKEDLLEKAQERAKEFRALPGLVQKYYLELDTNYYSGVYIWDSKASFLKFKDSELAKTIGPAYQVTEPPSVDVGDVMFKLRE